jgi:hypothetical protein
MRTASTYESSTYAIVAIAQAGSRMSVFSAINLLYWMYDFDINEGFLHVFRYTPNYSNQKISTR